MEKVYLYLVKRNKSDAKIIGNMFSEHTIHPTRLSVHDLDKMGLNAQERGDVEKLIHDNRLEWEPWIASAADYQALRDKLHKNGVSAPPSPNAPTVDLKAKKIPTHVKGSKTMTRRMS